MTWQLALLEELVAASAPDPAVGEVQVIGSVARGEASLDVWSDLDVVVSVHTTGIERVGGAAWSARFGRPWAAEVSRATGELVRRTVYADGRRLDLVIWTDRGRLPAGVTVLGPRPAAADARPTPAADSPDRDLDSVRFAAALAVVKLARGDLLIGMHLALEVVRSCLVQGMRLRDRDLGTTVHRGGSSRDGVVAELDRLRRHPWTAAGGMALLEEATVMYDRLTEELDPGYRADWSGLQALLSRTGRA